MSPAEAVEKFNAIVWDLRQQMKQAFQPVCDSMFDSCLGLEFIVVQGYTPQFNDGEEISHISNIYVNGYAAPPAVYRGQISGAYWDAELHLPDKAILDGTEGLVECEYVVLRQETQEALMAMEVPELQFLGLRSLAPVVELPGSLESVIEGHMEDIYGTNYVVLLTKDGIYKKDYDCGY